MVPSLGIPEDCLDFSFELIRGMTPAEALFEHRLNRLFAALSAQPRQGLRRAIVACGLSASRNVVGRFEQAFGIEMSLFLLTCRRAAEDRELPRHRPEEQALILGH
jgi:methylphosphotriester-DNA--protein-cysteine methyltransferase